MKYICNCIILLIYHRTWFSTETSASATNKTDCHDITEKLLKVALNTINQPTICHVFPLWSGWHIALFVCHVFPLMSGWHIALFICCHIITCGHNPIYNFRYNCYHKEIHRGKTWHTKSAMCQPDNRGKTWHTKCLYYSRPSTTTKCDTPYTITIKKEKKIQYKCSKWINNEEIYRV
jgi:hypothetical protein